MTDWIEHDGGPPPVAYDLSQYVRHLIDAARLEGIRLGLEAAAIVAGSRINYPREVEMRASILRLDPATIAREAVLDKLVSEAQEQGMGYEKEADQ